MPNTLILCDCSGSIEVDAKALGKASGFVCSRVHSGLCTHETEAAAKAMTTPGAIICCTQEQAYFEQLAAEVGGAKPAFLDLRDRAGWSVDTTSKLPKMTALLAEASLPAPREKSVDIISEGMCLIVGSSQVAIPAADALKDFLSVTLLLDHGADLPTNRDYDVVCGTLRKASGSLGQFEVTIDGLQQIEPAGRGAWSLSDARDGGRSGCDIILDLSGATPLFPAHEKRDGYLRADPAGATAVAQAILQASHMVGTFEKPLYVRTEAILCAHSRAEQPGCSNCLDVCPTGAISPAGDHVSVDPMICAGCGACSALCPSGAITYDAPPVADTFKRIQTLARAFQGAGGDAPRLLVVNAHGGEMIRLAARFGDGLPANVVPLEVAALNAFGHAEAVAAVAAGFSDVVVVPGPTTDLDALAREVELGAALAGAVSILDTSDPDLLSEKLFAGTTVSTCASPVRPVGTRRQITRQSAKALHAENAQVPLPAGAPYGAVVVDAEACTLCLSCVSLCPSGALGDNPDLPQLRFQEDACLQCGLCSTVCPENAIAYQPRLNLAASALEQVVLNEEEPFACVECGALFGVKSTVEKVMEKLAGNHAMFSDPNTARMIQMCDTCRIQAQYHAKDNPFSGAERPRVRTTEDYLSKRKDH